jgi:hypothetical protein
VTEAAERLLRRLLRQARAWFSRHPERDDAVAVEADPREVQRWMCNTDHALLDEAGPGHEAGRSA